MEFDAEELLFNNAKFYNLYFRCIFLGKKIVITFISFYNWPHGQVELIWKAVRKEHLLHKYYNALQEFQFLILDLWPHDEVMRQCISPMFLRIERHRNYVSLLLYYPA